MILDEHIESIVGNLNTGLIWVNSTEGKVFGWDGAFCQDVEKGRFADVWETDNTNFEVGSHATQNLGRLWRHFLLLWWHFRS